MTTSILRRTPASSRPVPRPTIESGAIAVSAQSSAAAGVLFAIPISPMPISVAPLPASSRAISIPTSSARVVSSGVIAGPSRKLRVPAPMRRYVTPASGFALVSIFTPTSTTFSE